VGQSSRLYEVLGGMLPSVDALFTLVRQLARRAPVTEVAAPKWLVQRHGLGAMAARAGATSYRDDLARATLEWARIEDELPLIVASFRGAGVRVAPIKGAAYAKSIYASPAERPMGDVDLLVRANDLAEARRVLRELGFSEARSAVLHHAEPWTRGDRAIDLHWNIIAPGRSRIDLEEVWSRVSPGWPQGSDQLEANDALLFHLVHLSRNRLRLPLMNVVDTARLLERANLAETISRANGWGIGSAVKIALRFSRAILDDRDRLRPAGWLGPTRDEVIEISEGNTASKLIFDVATAGSLRQLASRVVHFGANQFRRPR
jgi:putative nucleotidyltransferase-like protein